MEDIPITQTGWSYSSRKPSKPRERILCAASQLFCHGGFTATGIDAVIAKAGVAKATLYSHFSSKELLIASVLEEEGAAWRAWFFSRLAAGTGSAPQQLLSMFDILESWFADPNFYGCPFINAIAEFEDGNELVGKAASHHKHMITSWIRGKALELGSADPEALTRSMVVLIDGAIVAAQHTRDPTFAGTSKNIARIMLTTAKAPS